MVHLCPFPTRDGPYHHIYTSLIICLALHIPSHLSRTRLCFLCFFEGNQTVCSIIIPDFEKWNTTGCYSIVYSESNSSVDFVLGDSLTLLFGLHLLKLARMVADGGLAFQKLIGTFITMLQSVAAKFNLPSYASGGTCVLCGCQRFCFLCMIGCGHACRAFCSTGGCTPACVP